MASSGITFIYSNVDFVDVTLPYSLSETMILRAAIDVEVEKFKNYLAEYGRFSRFIIPFDHSPVDMDENGVKKTIYRPDKFSRWWVIAFNGCNSQVYDLDRIAKLIKPKLYLGVTFLYDELNQHSGTIGKHSDVEILTIESAKKYSLVNSNELNKLKEYYNWFLLEDISATSSSKYALDLYCSTSNLGIHSGLLTLSLFSVIESLIAHKPRLTETLDSITHQIKNKINLLVKMFENSIDKESYFGDIAYMTLWGKLYGLRSDIAHGQKYDFSKSYSCLKNLENVNNFLDEIVRELICLTIQKPDLIADIKEC